MGISELEGRETVGGYNRPPQRTRADVERTIGVDPIEQLHEKRRALWREHARLYARTETWQERRKKLVCLISVEIMNSYEFGGDHMGEKRPAADLIDAMAHADERYGNFLAAAEDDIARWALVEVMLREIDELINRDQRVIGFATAEARL